MPRFEVTLPVVGWAIMEVEAADEALAIDKAVNDFRRDDAHDVVPHEKIMIGGSDTLRGGWKYAVAKPLDKPRKQ